MKVVMVRAYAHRGFTEMARKEMDGWEEAYVSQVTNHPRLGRCYVGSFIQGVGAFHVHFPEADVRLATAEEVQKMTRGRYRCSFAPDFRLVEEHFATLTDLDAFPVVDWRKF